MSFHCVDKETRGVSAFILAYFRGGGVTTIYEGTGCAIFWGAFFQQKINFGVSFLVK